MVNKNKNDKNVQKKSKKYVWQLMIFDISTTRLKIKKMWETIENKDEMVFTDIKTSKTNDQKYRWPDKWFNKQKIKMFTLQQEF